MLGFSAAALAEMGNPTGCAPVLRAYLTLPTAGEIELTPYVERASEITNRIPAVGTETDLGQLTLTLADPNGNWSPDNSAGRLAGEEWYNAPGVIKAGVKLPTGGEETLAVWTGLLDSAFTTPDGWSTLKFLHPTERLRNVSTLGMAGKPVYANLTRHDDCPSALILRLLLWQYWHGLDSSWIDTASFDAATIRERRERLVCRDYKLSDGTWWQEIQKLLRHTLGLVCVGADGKITFRWIPPYDATPTFTLPGSAPIVSIASVGAYTGVKNKIAVTRSKADLSGAEPCTGSPFYDAGSVARYGSRSGGADLSLFAEDRCAAPIGWQTMLQAKTQMSSYQAVAGWSAVALEPGDAVSVTDRRLGLSAVPMIVVQVMVSPNHTVTLDLVRGYFTIDGYLACGHGHADGVSRQW